MTITVSVPPTEAAPALWLRPWRPDDLTALVAEHRDPELRHRLTTSLSGEAEARQWLDAQAAGWKSATRFSFTVVADDDVPLGHIAVKPTTAGVAVVGYWTAARARGQGIAARALEVMSQWALHTQHLVRLTRIDLLHAEDNPASCRVAEKCGYRLAELLPPAPPAPPAFPARGHRHVRSAQPN